MQLEVLENITLKDLISNPTKELLKYYCSVKTCTFKFASATELEKHSKLHGEFKCAFCGTRKRFAPTLALHEDGCPSRVPYHQHRKLKTQVENPTDDKKCVSANVTLEGISIENSNEQGLDNSPPRPTPRTTNRCPRCPFTYYSKSKVSYITHHLSTHLNLDVPVMFYCPLCQKRFYQFINSVTKGHVVNHIIFNHDISGMNPLKVFTCKICPAVKFRNYNQLSSHRKECHPKSCILGHPKKKKKKKLTNRRKNKMKNLKHFKTSLSQNKYRCDDETCNLRFIDSRELENHKKHHGNFSCQTCQEEINNAIDLALHECKHCSSDKSKIQCSRCIMTFSNDDQVGRPKYVKHFLDQHLSLPWVTVICKICQAGDVVVDYKRGSKKKRAIHFWRFHNVSNMDPAKVAKCDEPECPAFFKNFRQLQSHKRSIHEAGSSKVCKECGRKLKTLKGLKTHLVTVHKYDPTDPTKFPVACKDPGCPERFTTKELMECHASYCHDNIPSVKCPKCQKVFYGDHILRRHLELQTCDTNKAKRIPVQSTFVCETCGKIFLDKYRLHLHNLAHLGPDAWEFCCETCGKKCMTKQKLGEHMRTHTQDKPFQCSYCGEKYAHRHNLRIHVNNKHGDIAQDVPQRFDKTNLTSRKGIPLGKRETTSDKKRQSKQSESGGRKHRKKRKAETSSSESANDFTSSEED